MDKYIATGIILIVLQIDQKKVQSAFDPNIRLKLNTRNPLLNYLRAILLIPESFPENYL